MTAEQIEVRAAALLIRADKFRPVLALPDVREAAALLRETIALVEEIAHDLARK